MDELKVADRKTRKLLTIHRGLYPRSNVDHLYLPRKKGGRGLKSVEDVVAEEKCSLYYYLGKSEEPLLNGIGYSCCI